MSNYPGLKLGDVLPATGILQRLLVRAGHHVTIDGEFGSGTKHALQDFQRSFGMTATGKTDPLHVSFQLDVRPANHAPKFKPLAPVTVYLGRRATIDVAAEDSDLPDDRRGHRRI